jgi:hypothetical protein
VGHLINHFFSDITHFDSQIFTTIKDLVFKPGFLTKEYISGRRLRYLNPIRMYVFISAVFFLVMFAGSEEESGHVEDNNHAVNLYRQHVADSLRSAPDTARKTFNSELASQLDTAEALLPNTEALNFSFGSSGKIVIDMTENKYNNLKAFDSLQARLPDSAREKGILGWMLRKNIKIKEEHGHRSHIRIEKNIQHTIPKIMFVLLPLFALFTSWFYSRKEYVYTQHAIFSIHFHSFMFLLFLLFLLIGKLFDNQWSGIFLAAISLLLVFVYLVAALHGMYRQNFWLSLGKAAAICILYTIAIILAFGVIMLLAFLQA